jgi:hypothetical protein
MYSGTTHSDRTLDPLTQAWIAAGGVTGVGQIGKLDQVMKYVRNNGLLYDPVLDSGIVRMNLFAGSTLASALIPQIAEVGNTADTNTGFAEANYTEVGTRGGIEKTGSAYLNTGFPANSLGTRGALGVLMTTRWPSVSTTECLIGMRNITPTNQYLMIRAYSANTLSIFWSATGIQGTAAGIYPKAAGSIYGLYAWGSQCVAHFDNVSVGNIVPASNPGVTDSLYLFANNGPGVEYHMAAGRVLGGYYIYKGDASVTAVTDTRFDLCYNALKLWGELMGRRGTV